VDVPVVWNLEALRTGEGCTGINKRAGLCCAELSLRRDGNEGTADEIQAS
jgi:hypothetical protein